MLYIAFTTGLCLTVAASGEGFTPEQLDHFESKVRPVLVEHCIDCHGPDKQKSELRLDSRAALIRGGTQGSVVQPGQPERSQLVHVIRRGGDIEMPPGDPLDETAVQALVDWVNMGAPWPESPDAPDAQVATVEEWVAQTREEHWSFRPVASPAIPESALRAESENEIDQFIGAGLESAGLSFAPEADRRALLRRLSYDLTGLPPTQEELEAFEQDPSPLCVGQTGGSFAGIRSLWRTLGTALA